MAKYLKERSYYEKIYDVHTIEICIDLENYDTSHITKGIDGTPEEKEKKAKAYAKASNHFMIEFRKLDRAAYRRKTVDEWVGRDQKKMIN